MKKLLLVLSCTALTACGGGSSSSSSTTTSGDSSTSAAVEKNVALASNGATVTAGYDQTGAANVIDGDTTSAKSWTGSAANDAVTVKFDKAYDVSTIVVYTNHLSTDSGDREKYIEISSDGSTWKETALAFNADVACSGYLASASESKISCSYNTAQNIQYVRVRLAKANSTVNVYEIEATGK